ncbi:hypothetical protein N656DRAFT_844254 [Canariomyces notabilis]|uniref:GPI inositol-deacylase n=1 Tax=Canariomyces notabilis TaxID=2074819 RepID=A0AAN6TF62_9PEZI|nr:hypothetical protein N656DRAFT_844254 [Canariomyces arenarius]
MDFRHSSDPGPVDGSQTAEGSDLPPPYPWIARSFTSSSIPRVNLRSFSFHRKASESKAEDVWGPVGLNLLYSPPDPIVDLIFVHGLRGGSVKTWCKSDDLRLYWPQAWLPQDPDLQNARIHSFGYNSDWAETKETCLDLHDFGRSLLGEMVTSSELRKGSQTPILLIGHSMGGLVIKKAYLLAQQDDRSRDLARRIQCMFFLGTPHRGSDSAKLLNNVLRASAFLSPKAYVVDINRNSGAISVINDEFRFYSDSLHIWSFYETVKTRLGTVATMIVDRDSAIIGHRREVVNPMNADHRNMCKFESPTDPNYIFIRNSLVKATEDVLGDVFDRRADETRLQTIMLEAYLHIAHYPEDDLHAIESKKSDGSCEWVTDSSLFRQWRDDETESVFCYWLSGQAGAGKSVLSTHIVRHLQNQGVDTCFYLFRHGQKAKQTASSLLRAFAFQMASLHPSIRKMLTAMREGGVMFDKDDERGIWRKIFVNGILPTAIQRTQYWVVDGLDECVDPERLLPLICNFESNFKVRILFSSRRLPELEKHLARFGDRLLRHHISINDTLSDIQRFIENNSDELPVEPEHRPQLIEKLVNKSDGTFLWIELAFEELSKVFSEDEVDEVLDQVPEGMAPLYNRILEAMAKNDRQVRMTRAILEWTVCGTRPLSTEELQAALALDLNTKVRNVERVIEELCGQLLRIDDNRHVHILHATAREFLLSKDSHPVFQMDKDAANHHLALVCLKYLNSEEMRPPRHPALVGKPVTRSAFVDYACTSFSEHLASSPTASDEVFLLLDKFFRTNVLAWVEYILARKRNLYYITRASKNLRRYLDRRSKYAPPLGVQYSNIQMWQTDLLRIALRFGENLLKNPSCIHFLVPPLCPTETAVNKLFGRTIPKSLQLSGLTNSNWDDCICYIDYRESRALSLAASDGFFAIGMKSGDIKVYQQSTCQQIATFVHGEPVGKVRFDNASQYLVSASFKKLKMWTIEGELLWTVANATLLSAISFTEDGKYVVTLDRYGNINTLNICDGTKVQPDLPGDSAKKTNLSQGAWRVISDADICPKTELVAISYRGWPPQIWSIEQDVMIGTCNLSRDKPGVHIMPVSQLLFNPNPAIELIAVAYQDGELAIFDKWPGGPEIKAISANALTLAATVDGRTLATGDAKGTIKLWDFETLTLLYWIKSTEHDVRSMAFSGDGFRLYDIRDTKTKVWEPAALVRKGVSEDSSVSESVHSPVPIIERDRELVGIMQILSPPEAGCIFVGKADGSVVVYDSATGDIVSSLYSHGRGWYAFVRSLSWNRHMIASADASNNITVHTLEKVGPNNWKVTARVFEKRPDGDGDIQQLLLHPASPLLLVLKGSSEMLFKIDTQSRIPLSDRSCNGYRSCLWLPSASGSVLLLGVRATEPVIDIFAPDAEGLEYQLRDIWDLGTSEIPVSCTIRSISTDATGSYLAVLLENNPKLPPGPGLLIYRIPVLSLDGLAGSHAEITELPALTIPDTDMKTFFGFYKERLVFLDHELWVKSIDLSKVHAGTTLDSLTDRHFFIPRELIGSNNGVDGVVTDTGTVVFPKEGELAVVRHALEWTFVANDTNEKEITPPRRAGTFEIALRGGRRRGLIHTPSPT